jgi:VIT1/CCC1 family predicted Fe2+/Mn2+ transporter
MRKNREKFLGEFVYGWIDGTVTTFAVVAGATWWNLTIEVILILGFANLIADWVSMSIGNYLSTKAENDQYIKEHKKNDPNQMPPRQTALATFIAFVVLGFFPLLIYMLQYMGLETDPDQIFFRWCIITGITFALIGLIKWAVTHTSIFKSIVETLGLGTIAAVLAYYVGNLLEKLIAG